MAFAYSSTSNHLDSYCYDAAGNLLNSGGCVPTGSKSPNFYDAYGALLSANYNAVDFTSYSVDEEERQVAKWQNPPIRRPYRPRISHKEMTSLLPCKL